MNNKGEGGDSRDPGEPAAPPRTIVGGRPAGEDRTLHGLPMGIQKLLVAASLDDGYKARLVEDPLAAARAAHVGLSAGERALLKAVPKSQLELMASRMAVSDPQRRRFLLAAATAILAVIAGAGCRNEEQAPAPASLPVPPGLLAAGGKRPGVPEISLNSLAQAMSAARELWQPVMVLFPVYSRQPWTRGISPHLPPRLLHWLNDESLCFAVDRNHLLTAVVHDPRENRDYGEITPEQYADSAAFYKQTLERFQVRRLPTVLFLAPDGSLLGRCQQPRKLEQLLESIESASRAFEAWVKAHPRPSSR